MPTQKLSALYESLADLACPQKKQVLSGFFKTGVGEYGYGDIFLGVTVPKIRQIAKQYRDLTEKELKTLLASPIHERRFCALLILIHYFEQAKEKAQRQYWLRFYLENLDWVNNWDLVDLSAPKILGVALCHRQDSALLKSLSQSENLWHRRIAIVSTWPLIKQKQFSNTLYLARRYCQDQEDLIHKATGWMLRELGKQDVLILRHFLEKHVSQMPRTMLRYSIERLDKKERQYWLEAK